MLIEIKDLEQLRKLRWLSYRDLEEQNLSRWTYHSIINLKRPASKKSIEKLTQIFRVKEKDIIWLLKG